jgi:6-phosphogluconolactonase
MNANRRRQQDAQSIQPFDQLQQLHDAAANAFCDAVQETLATSEVFRVSLSGGSTPRRLYELLAERDLPWDKIHWFWGDERNVPHDDVDSNARMVDEALLYVVPAPEANVHKVPVRIEDPASAAITYEQTLREHFSGDRFPAWDLALLGMGDDGHTASLFPDTLALDEQERWFVENWVEKFNAFRYTLTAPAINSAKRSWFLISGSGKKEAMEHVLGEASQPHMYPSQLICPTRWFVTRDAWV